METITQNWWLIFMVCFTIVLLTTLLLSKIATGFFVEKDGRRSFSVFDLEFPASENQLNKLLFFSTSDTRKQLRKHLWIDFIFMPAAYIGIALLCYKASMKMEFVGKYVFLVLAALQALPWLFDIIENIYLFNKLSKAKEMQNNVADSRSFNTFQLLVKAKFAIAFTGLVCAVFGLFYFWLMGAFSKGSLIYLAVLFAEILLFLWLSSKKAKVAVA